VEKLKIPPHSVEAEQSVLGAILSMQQCDRLIGEAFDKLRDDMFYNLSHRLIFNAMLKIGAKGVIDLITITELLEENNKLEDAGGFAYVAELARNTPSKANILAYCDIVVDRHYKRELIGIATQAIESLYNGDDTGEVMEYLSLNIKGIDLGGSYEPLHISEKIPDFMGKLQKRADGDQSELGYKTGITRLDDQIKGIKGGWLVVVGGRPSMKKTLITQLISANMSRELPNIFFTMEMTSDEIMDRYIGLMAGVDPENLRVGLLSDYEFSRTNQVLSDMANRDIKIHYDETVGLSVEQISYRVKSSKKKLGKLGAIFIDYLGLMQLPKANSKTDSIALITKRLKELAKEVDTPIFLIVQANREADKANRLGMGNAADSAAIERDADLMFFVHREEVQDPHTEYTGVVEIVPAKFRHGTFANSVFMKTQDDVDGGKMVCLNDTQLGALEHHEKLRKDADSPKKYKKEFNPK
jgi:replicative DNA helicase